MEPDRDVKAGPDDRTDGDPVLSCGRIFAGRYQIEELLGVGGFAKVYRAEQTDIGRDVAIKVLDPDRLGGDDGLSTAEKRFYREARLMSKLEGPNTVRLYDYGRTRQELLYTVFEYIDGTDLDDLMRAQAPFDEERTRRILRQILRSLHEAHDRSILHRDVKPSNVMVFDHAGERDRVKLLDFGIAKMVAAEAGNQQNLTIEGMVVGTPRYMSPEQTLGQPLGPPSDLFSTGLLVYEMLVGNSPFDSAELSMVRRRIDSAPIRLPMGIDVSDELRDLTNRLLERDVEDRIQSTSDALENLGVEMVDSDPETSTSPERTRQGNSFPIGLDSSGIAPVDDLTGTSEKTTTRQSGAGLAETGSAPARETPPGRADSQPFGSAPTIVDPGVGPSAAGQDRAAPPPEAADGPPERSDGKAAPSERSTSPEAADEGEPGSSTLPNTTDLKAELEGTSPGSRWMIGLAVLLTTAAGGWWFWGTVSSQSSSEASGESEAVAEHDPGPEESPAPDPSESNRIELDRATAGAKSEIGDAVDRAGIAADDDARESARGTSSDSKPDRTSPPTQRSAPSEPTPSTDETPLMPPDESSTSDDETEIKPIDEYLAE